MIFNKWNFRRPLRNILFGLNKNPLSKYLYQQEINKRSKLPLTEIVPLSQHIPMLLPFTSEIQPLNDWYGHATALKTYLGLPLAYQFKFIIEHGLYLSDQVADLELEANLPTFITHSKYRVKILKKHRPYAFSIGPLIHYASHYLTKEELVAEKKRLGQTILFFPSHSIIGLTNRFDENWNYKKIKEISKGFKTIRVCLYWKDILEGKHLYYLKQGCECVTAGHILDPFFLPRVKSIIETSDLTVSNDASSPLSYCVFMNKPYIIFYQRPKMTGWEYHKKLTIDSWKAKPYLKVIDEFSQIRFSLSKKQKALMSYYTGTDQIKSPKELARIISKSEDIYQHYESTHGLTAGVSLRGLNPSGSKTSLDRTSSDVGKPTTSRLGLSRDRYKHFLKK